jgi:hypothetical protein
VGVTPEIKVQCFGCNSVLLTTLDTLKSGATFDCRFCGEDLRPAHRDPACGFCRGEGFASVNDVVWICLGNED